MKHLDLFSGIGGFALAAKWAWRKEHEILSFVENNKYCQELLAKNFPGVSIHSDIKTFRGTQYRGTVDLITGGFPCQPYSVAGKQRGAEDDRALWPEMFRIIQESKPAWIIGENVPQLANMELDQVLFDLEGEDYETQTFNIPACAVDARHKRERLWIIAHAEISNDGECESEKIKRQIQKFGKNNIRVRGYWPVEPDVGRVANGIPKRMDRVKSLGNAIVPQVAYVFMQIVKTIEETERKNQ
jgi:DNA (cytosine-5)-methyltransferase 1